MHGGGTRVVRGWFEGGTRVVRGWYAGGTRVVRGWYEGDTGGVLGRCEGWYVKWHGGGTRDGSRKVGPRVASGLGGNPCRVDGETVVRIGERRFGRKQIKE